MRSLYSLAAFLNFIERNAQVFIPEQESGVAALGGRLDLVASFGDHTLTDTGPSGCQESPPAGGVPWLAWAGGVRTRAESVGLPVSAGYLPKMRSSGTAQPPAGDQLPELAAARGGQAA